jgi:hypothetical protein
MDANHRPPRSALVLFVLLNVVVMAVCLVTLWPILAEVAAILTERASTDRLATVAGLIAVLAILGLGRNTTKDR